MIYRHALSGGEGGKESPIPTDRIARIDRGTPSRPVLA